MEHPTWRDTVLVAGVVGLLVALIASVLMVALGVGSIFTCNAVLVLLPFVGYFALKIIAATSPKFLALHHNMGLVVLMGLALGWITVPSGRKESDNPDETNVRVSARI